MGAVLLYFAYGSNMCLRRLRGRAPSAVPVATGYVAGRRLAFDKISVDGSGKCDCEATGDPADRVYGVLCEIASVDRPALDRAEGPGRGYREERLDVVTGAGTRRALAYVATRKDPALRPYGWYCALVVAGAREHQLPAAYVARLEAVEAVQDPDAARRAAHAAILVSEA